MIRRLRPDDAALYRALRLDALHTDPDSFGATHAAEAALPLTSHAARLETSAVFAATGAGPLLGLAGMRQESGEKFAHKALLWGLWVTPAARGRGIAAGLMQAVLDHAQGRVLQLHLTVVHSNAPAIALYRRFGFIEYGREPRAIRTAAGLENECLMARLL